MYSAKIDPTIKSSVTVLVASIVPLLSVSSLPAVSSVLSDAEIPNANPPAAYEVTGENTKNNPVKYVINFFILFIPIFKLFVILYLIYFFYLLCKIIS